MVQLFPLTDYPLIKLWDLTGNEESKSAKYAEEMKFKEYDAFVVLTKDKFHKHDTKIAARTGDKPVFYARTNMDITMEEESKNQLEGRFSHTQTEDTVKRNCKDQLKDKNKRIFLISARDSMMITVGGRKSVIEFPDNNLLKEAIFSSLKGELRTALGKLVSWCIVGDLTICMSDYRAG